MYKFRVLLLRETWKPRNGDHAISYSLETATILCTRENSTNWERRTIIGWDFTCHFCEAIVNRRVEQVNQLEFPRVDPDRLTYFGFFLKISQGFRENIYSSFCRTISGNFVFGSCIEPTKNAFLCFKSWALKQSGRWFWKETTTCISQTANLFFSFLRQTVLKVCPLQQINSKTR